MSVHGSKCPVYGCRNYPHKLIDYVTGKPVRFFKFPNATKYFLEWVRFCGHPEITERDYPELRTRMMCSRHFDSSQFLRPRFFRDCVLKDGAIPSLRDEEPISSFEADSVLSMSSENGQSRAISANNNNSSTPTNAGIPQFAQQQMQSLPLGRQVNQSPNPQNQSNQQPPTSALQPNSTQQAQGQTPGHASSPAVRPGSCESADTEVLQTSDIAPSSRRTFSHVLLSRPIKSEPADDDITIVGQTMARAPVNQVRFIQPQVIPHNTMNPQLMARQMPQSNPQLIQHAHQQSNTGQRIATALGPGPQATVVGQIPVSSAVHIRPPLTQPRAIAPGPPNSNVIRLVRSQGGNTISMVRGPAPMAPQYVTRLAQPLMPPQSQMQQIHQPPVSQLSGQAPLNNQSSHRPAVIAPSGQGSSGGGNASNTFPSEQAAGSSSGGTSSSTGQQNADNNDGFPGVHARLTSVDRLMNNLVHAQRFLDNRSVLNHEDLVELFNADRLLQSFGRLNEFLTGVFQKDGGPFRCVECVDTFATQEAYNGHRERNSVEINYDCDHCTRVRSFGNKCALFSHVRGHRKGSIDPTKLKIRVANGRRTANSSMRRHLDATRDKLEKYARAVEKAQAAETESKASAESHETTLKEARAMLEEIEAAARTEEMDTSELAIEVPGCEEERLPAPASTSSSVHVDATGKEKGMSATGPPGESAISESVKKSSDESNPCVLSNGEDHQPVSAAEVVPNEGESFKCIFCKERFRSPAALRRHFVGSDLSSGRSDVSEPSSAAPAGPSVSPSSVQTNCPLCRMMVHSGRTLCALKAHLLFHLDAGRVCPDCGFVATEADELKAEVTMRRHLHTECLHFQQVYVNLCTFCPEEEQRAYHNPSQLAVHVKQSHCPRLFQCSVCEQTYENEYSWQRHLVTAHHVQASTENRRVVFQCPVCNQHIKQREGVLQRGDVVRTHIEQHCTENEHSLTEAYRCFAQCKQIFYDQGSLRDHMENCSHFTSMSPVAEDKLPCLLCLRVNSHHLRTGERSASNQTLRQQVFSILSMLRTHERSHLRWTTLSTAAYPSTLQCPWCQTELNLSQRSESESHLAEHARQTLNAIASESSVDDAPNPPTTLFTCHCGYQINSLFDLSSHLTTTVHPVVSEEKRGSGELVQPISCSDCGEKFNRLTLLIDHIYSEHPSLCYFCNSFHAGSRAELPSHLWSCMVHVPRIGDLGPTQVLESMVQRSSHNCPRCTDSFYSLNDMLVHLHKAHSVQNRFPCLLCECLYVSVEALKHHTQTAHAQAVMGGAGALRCWHCPKTFEKRNALERHVMSAHKVSRQDVENSRPLKREHRDDEEGKSSSEEVIKRVRLMKRNGNFTETYECANCVFSTKDRMVFLEHINLWHRNMAGDTTNQQVNPLQCPECGLCFYTEIPLSIHLTAVHKISRTNSQVYITDHWHEIRAPPKEKMDGKELEKTKEEIKEKSTKGDAELHKRAKHRSTAEEGQTDCAESPKREDACEPGACGDASKYTCNGCKTFTTDSLDLLKKHERSHGLHFLKNYTGGATRHGTASENESGAK